MVVYSTYVLCFVFCFFSLHTNSSTYVYLTDSRITSIARGCPGLEMISISYRWRCKVSMRLFLFLVWCKARTKIRLYGVVYISCNCTTFWYICKNVGFMFTIDHERICRRFWWNINSWCFIKVGLYYYV